MNIGVGINTSNPNEKLEVNGAIKFGDGGYTAICNGDTTPVPKGGAGTIIFEGSNFFGWNGTAWRQLND